MVRHEAELHAGRGCGGPGRRRLDSPVRAGPWHSKFRIERAGAAACGRQAGPGRVWMPPYVPDMTVNRRDQRGYAEPPFSPDDTPQTRLALYAKANKAELPFTPWGLQDWSTYDAASGDYTGSCFPFGLQRSVNAPYPFQIVQDDRHVALLFEINTWHHVIPITKLSFEADGGQPDVVRLLDRPLGRGHIRGRDARLQRYTRLDTVGHPHSDAFPHADLHAASTPRDGYTVTIDDRRPTRSRGPTNGLRLHNGPLMEYSARENNKSLWDGRIKTWSRLGEITPDSTWTHYRDRRTALSAPRVRPVALLVSGYPKLTGGPNVGANRQRGSRTSGITFGPSGLGPGGGLSEGGGRRALCRRAVSSGRLPGHA